MVPLLFGGVALCAALLVLTKPSTEDGPRATQKRTLLQMASEPRSRPGGQLTMAAVERLVNTPGATVPMTGLIGWLQRHSAEANQQVHEENKEKVAKTDDKAAAETSAAEVHEE